MITDFLHNNTLLNFTQLRLCSISSLQTLIGMERWEELVDIWSQKQDISEVRNKLTYYVNFLGGFEKLSWARYYILIIHRCNISDKYIDNSPQKYILSPLWWLSPMQTERFELIPKHDLRDQKVHNENWKETGGRTYEKKLLKRLVERIPEIEKWKFSMPQRTYVFNMPGMPPKTYTPNRWKKYNLYTSGHMFQFYISMFCSLKAGLLKEYE